MATWKRLTRTSGPQVDVNIDAVLHMQRHQDKHTTLHFSVAVGDKIHFSGSKRHRTKFTRARPSKHGAYDAGARRLRCSPRANVHYPGR
jgi:hypothetical protein